MKTLNETVRTQDGNAWNFDMPLPESLDEAVEVYGEENALALLNSGLKTKLQHTAREGFRQGRDTAEVEEAVKNYRPGSSSRKNTRQRALDLITDKAVDIQADPELKSQVKEAFKAGMYKDIISMLEGGED